MKEIALIHTVQSVAVTFGKELSDYLGEEVKIYNLWDQFLSINPNEVGEFTKNNQYRLLNDVKNAELTGADIIVISCSTLTPHIKAIRPYISIPIVAIDDAMAARAISFGNKILAVATAKSTIQPTTDKLHEEAAKAGKRIEVDQKVIFEAYLAMQENNMEKHDRVLKEAIKTVRDYDCIVLAQASMASCATDIENITGIPTLASLELCMEQIKEILGL